MFLTINIRALVEKIKMKVTNKVYIYCPVCGRKYEAKTPKGGDGSMLVPRKHSRDILPLYDYGNTGSYAHRKEVCPGSWQEGIDIE
jgi:hypothetical protein